jgi:hypothetical protein
MERGNLSGRDMPESREFPCLWPTKFSHPRIDSMARRLRKVFESLPHLGYLGPMELKDYAYYENLIVRALLAIDEKATRGDIVPIDIRDYPKVLRYPKGIARITAYIGTFDPFQLTHLTIALRLLASPRNSSDLVIVVPEGAASPEKPRKTEYAFRYQLAKAQLEGLFEPFILPLDIGANADTIEIVRRLIAMHAGMKLELTHLIGSDVLPIASSFIHQDLAVWRKQALASGVDFRHSVHVSRRSILGPFSPFLSHIRKAGVPAVFERSIVGTPSSTDFRENRAITLVLPTEKIRDKLEIVFRYNMNRPWSAG